MKRLMTSVLLSASLLTGAAAYAGPDYGYHGGKNHVERLAKRLDLTDDQKVAIEDIYRSYGSENKKVHKQHKRGLKRGFAELDPTAADYHERLAEMARAEGERVEQSIIRRGEIHAKVYEVLTPEQREKLHSKKMKRDKKWTGNSR